MKRLRLPRRASKQGGAVKKDRAKVAKRRRFSLRGIKPSAVFVRSMVVALVVIVAAGGFLWWRFVFQDAEVVFRDALKQTLRTHSITKVTEQEGPGQSIEQINRLLLGAQAAVLSQTTITQSDGDEVIARVVTDEIGTTERDYIRYREIDTTQESDDGTVLDFQDVAGVWGVSSPDQTIAEDQGEAFGEATLGIVPFGLVSKADQKRLYNFLVENDVYQVDYLAVVRQPDAARFQYVYPVRIQPEPYVQYLKLFAEAQGLNRLQNVSPEMFRGVPAVPFTLTIDVLSRNIVAIDYDQAGRSEQIDSVGALQYVRIPEETVPIAELQQRLQEVQ
jgi:hypothetical protein